MELLFDLLKIIIPCGVVFATAFFLVKNFLENENKKRSTELKAANQQQLIPIRLQAFERIILFLERISPNNLVMRVHKSGMSARLLQAELVKTIRAEFEHNLSQQIYMSANSWEMVKGAKEEMIKLVNLSSSKVGDNATGMDLGSVMIELGSKLQKLPTQNAIDYLKKEIAQTF